MGPTILASILLASVVLAQDLEISAEISVEAGRSLIVAVEGTTLSAGQKRLLSELRPAGVVILGGNISNREQTRALVWQIKNAVSGKQGVADLPLIYVDQEGGRVNRLRLGGAESAAALGRKVDEREAKETGAYYAREAGARGIGILLAPVLDLSAASAGGVIGDRAFGTEPDLVWCLGKAFADGVMEGGGLPVVKHFPGHGGAVEDSHERLAHLTLEGNDLERHLEPFRQAVGDGIPAIMVGHIACPALDPEHPAEPASMSEAMVTGLLRETWGYDGYIVTDDMKMGAVAGGMKEAAIKSIRAGCDAVMICDSNKDHLFEVAAAITKEAEKDREFLKSLEHGQRRLERFRSMLDKVSPEMEYLPVVKDQPAGEGEQLGILVEHIVREGDTLSKLAMIFGITPEAIRKANGLSDDTIRVGQRLSIPEQ